LTARHVHVPQDLEVVQIIPGSFISRSIIARRARLRFDRE